MKKKYAGMTVNERLYEANAIKDFDLAVARKDSKEIIRILKHIDVDDDSIQKFLKSLDINEV